MSPGNKVIDMMMQAYIEERKEEVAGDPYAYIPHTTVKFLAGFAEAIREGTYCPDPSSYHADRIVDLIMGYRLLKGEVDYVRKVTERPMDKITAEFYSNRSLIYKVNELVAAEDWEGLKAMRAAGDFGLFPIQAKSKALQKIDNDLNAIASGRTLVAEATDHGHGHVTVKIKHNDEDK